MSRSSNELILLTDPYWGRLSPVHQSTSLADTLLGNVFEPLVDLDVRGGIVPGAASSWEVSPKNDKIVFKVRENLKFSDGTPVDAETFRKSFLNSVLEEDRDGHNPNALDVLYRVKGFSKENARNGNVPGLRATGLQLTIEFETPFRTAIYELTGTRYSAWKKDGADSWLGTGPYVLSEVLENKKVTYKENRFAWRKPKYETVTAIGSENGLIDLCEGKGDIFVGTKMPAPEAIDERKCKEQDVQFTGGGFTAHALLSLNGKPGKLFSNPQHRLALQYAVHSILPEIFSKILDTKKYSLDLQFFPPFWPGRLDDKEAEKLLEKGKPLVAALAAATEKNPILMLTARPPMKLLQDALERKGIRFKSVFAVSPVETILKATYAKVDFDLNIHGSSVVGNDPDGLYHLLGKSGALSNEAIARPRVQEAMENGRSAEKPNLNNVYADASRAILEEVPAIHLAFLRGGHYFSGASVTPETSAINSDRFQFDLFRRK